ncbi:hypothetical protein K1X76_05600 [bacterium]|nr:hypothetical protein [bacterium]
MISTTTQTVSKEELIPLHTVQKIALTYAVLGLIVSAYLFWPSFSVIGGFTTGAIVGICNFRFIKFFVEKLLAPEAPKASVGFLFFLKIIGLIALSGFMILQVRVNTMAFVAGFGAIIVGIIGESVRSVFVPRKEN